MKRINQQLQSLSKKQALLPAWSFFVLTLLKMVKKDDEADFLGDNLPHVLMENSKII